MDQRLAANETAVVEHYLGRFLVDGAFPPKTFDFQDQRRCLIQGAHLTALANMIWAEKSSAKFVGHPTNKS